MSSGGGPSVGTVLAISAMTSALVSAAVSWGVTTGVLFPDDAEVPELVGLSVDAAHDMLEGRGLRMVNRGEVHNDDVEEGFVAAQQPGLGSVLRAGDEVTIRVSLGPAGVEVPDVTGLLLAPARARLVNRGLTPVDPPTEGGEGRPGSVFATDPSAGRRVDEGTRITITVVPEVRTVTVPDVMGQSIRHARTAITEAELVVGDTRRRFNDLRPAYVVLEQTPAGGTEVDPGSAVNLVINED